MRKLFRAHQVRSDNSTTPARSKYPFRSLVHYFKPAAPVTQRPSQEQEDGLSQNPEWRAAPPNSTAAQEQGDGLSQDPASEIAPVDASASYDPRTHTSDAAPMDGTNIWMKAEERLKQDKKKREILDAYQKILKAEFGAKFNPSDSTGRQKQLCQLLETKVQDLKEHKLAVRLGGHTLDVEKQLNSVFKSILIAKDLINTAAYASPPAAMACAGVAVILTVSPTLIGLLHSSCS